MVKTPQYTLGYCVDGKVVHCPSEVAKKQAKRLQTATTTTQPVLKKDVVSSYEKPQPRPHRKKGGRNADQKRRTKTSLLRTDPWHLTDLKNAAKTGRLWRAFRFVWYNLMSMEKREAAARGSAPAKREWAFYSLVRYLFSPDIENRTAVYYASLTGRTSIVQFLLGLLVVLRCGSSGSRQQQRTMRDFKGTYSEWLQKFGCLKNAGFTKIDFEVCVLNALHEEARGSMVHTQMTLNDIMDICRREMELLRAEQLKAEAGPHVQADPNFLGGNLVEWYLHLVASRCMAAVRGNRNKVAPKPSLNMEEEDEWDYQQHGDCDYEEADDDEEEADFYWEDDDSSEEEEEDAGMPPHEGALTASALASASPEMESPDALNAKISEALQVLEDHQAGQESYDNMSFVDVEAASVATSAVLVEGQPDEKDDDETARSDWDLVSDVGTVMSLESNTAARATAAAPSFSYRNALLTKASSQKPKPPAQMPAPAPLVAIAETTSAMSEEAVEDEDQQFDSHFVMDGIKGKGGRRRN